MPERLPIKSYLISDPDFYGTTVESVAAAITAAVGRQRPDFACFRDKRSGNYETLAAAFIDVLRSLGSPVKVLLHSDADAAYRLGADGVHLTSVQFDRIADAKSKGLFVVISCHTPEELEKALRLGADAATYSPVFASPGKGTPKGLEDLKETVGKISLNIFALGGITTPEQVKQVSDTGAYGFASIRYFV